MVAGIRALHGVALALFLCACKESAPVMAAPGDAGRGESLVGRYGCAACHALPGALNQGSNVGPPLSGMARRAYIAGVLANTPDNMARWLQNPPETAPGTAMPNLGLSAADAADVAAYLYTLR